MLQSPPDGARSFENRVGVGVAARLSRYLQVLTQAKKMGKDRISSQEIADYTNINATQIRRDLSNFGKFGKRGVGYSIDGLLGRDSQDPPYAGAAQHRARRCGPARPGDRGLTDLHRARDHDRRCLRCRPERCRPLDRLGRGQPVRPSEGPRPRQEHRRRRARSPGRRRSTGCGRPDRCGRPDHLQLLGSPARLPARCHGAHLESRRRAASRALFPPDLTA